MSETELERLRAELAEAQNLSDIRAKLLREAWDAHHDTMDERDALKAELAKREADVELGDMKISELNRIMLRLQKRAAEAEADSAEAKAAIERVRRLQEMTVTTSCRAGAIAQAEDTLAALAVPEAPGGET